jgi:trk system potassium uptake protein TrkH
MDIRSLKNVLKLLSVIGLALSVFFLIPVAVGALYQEEYGRYLRFDGLFFLFDLFVYLVLINHKIELSLKQGILSVNAVWILLGFAGSVPLMLYTDVTVVQAVFESVSGFTTTGATIYTDVESLPKMILMHRSLMQWLGGMGIIILGIGLFSLINPSGSLTLFKAESTGIKLEKMTPKIKDTALRLWGIYLLLTILDTVLLKLEGMTLFDAVNHAFSTISTGGFSTKNASFGYYDSPFILWTTVLFMLASGINFLAHLKVFYGDFGGYRHEEVKWYLIIFLILTSLLTLQHILHSTDTFTYSLTHASFTIASILSTTGFASLDYELWGQAAMAVIFVAMIVGGNAGSTAGGMKVIRYIVVVKSVFAEIKRVLHPSEMINIFIDRNMVQNKVLYSTFAFIAIYTFSIMIVTLYLFAKGYDVSTSLSSALASIGNIGPGFYLSGPSHNYAFFDSMDLSVLSAGMIAGRLEFFTAILLFSRTFWKKF